MVRHYNWIAAAVFFVPAGWVCSGSALGGEPDGSFAEQGAEVIEQLFGAAGGPSDTSEADGDSGVSVSTFDTVSLNVQNTELANVLQVLSVQGKRNIVPSPSVNGTVTANLYDVTFYEALDAILQQNGCGYREKGNFIYIYTLDELRKIEQTERRLVHKVVTLNYITATDASTFITPLLSSAGSVAISGNVGPGFQPSLAEAGADSFAHGHTMVIRDYAENIAEVEKVLAVIDTRPMQVMVEATILQADVNDNTEFGVDFSILIDESLDAVLNPLAPVTDLIAGTIGEATGIQNTVPQGGNAFQVGVVTNNVAAFVRALDSVTDTTIVANPKLLVLNRQKAEVLVGNKLGYLSTTSTATATTQTVEFLDTGTQLTVRPFVSKDGYIRLELKPQISDGTTRDVASGTGAVTIPDEETQELVTNVMVRDGQTVVLGGLFKEKTEITRDQVPFLGDIPIAGAAFKGKASKIERTEVIFLITPHVVRDEALFAAGDAAQDGVEMLRAGAREGLLPWSRSKMVAAHVRDALSALEKGDRQTALWEVDLALGLDPQQPEAIRLKEKLTGQRAYWPNSSMLDQAVDVMVERQTAKRRFRARPMVPDPRPGEPISDNEPLTGWDEPTTDTQAFAPAIEPQVTEIQSNAQVEPVEPAEITQTAAAESQTEAATEIEVEHTDSTRLSEIGPEVDAPVKAEAEAGTEAEPQADAEAIPADAMSASDRSAQQELQIIEATTPAVAPVEEPMPADAVSRLLDEISKTINETQGIDTTVEVDESTPEVLAEVEDE